MRYTVVNAIERPGTGRLTTTKFGGDEVELGSPDDPIAPSEVDTSINVSVQIICDQPPPAAQA